MINRLKEISNNLIIKENVDMSKYSTFKLGGNARYLVEVSNELDLKNLLNFLKSNEVRYIFLGNGSNTVFRDGMYEGVVIKFKEGSFSDVKFENDLVTVGANTLVSSFSKELLEYGLSGFEELSGIPGSIGGAVFMNAGAYEKSTSDLLVSCDAINECGKKEFLNAECDFSYRHSIFNENGYIVTSATFKLNVGNKEDILSKMKVYAEKRNTKQPIKYPSCGSAFKRPKDNFAGKLIEDCGLKGYRVGGVEVSTLHAGFLINVGFGTATDLVTIIDDITKKVYNDKKILLEPEIRII